MTDKADDRGQPTLWQASTDVRARVERPPSGQSRPVVELAKDRLTTPMEFRELWTIDQVANYLGVPKQTIYSWRHSGYGPQGFRVGKHLRWRAATVITWTVDMEREQ